MSTTTTSSLTAVSAAKIIGGYYWGDGSDGVTAKFPAIFYDETTDTFTPVLKFGGGSTGIVYGTQQGKYTKIGRLVFYHITIVLTNKGSSTGTATIDGLPLTVRASVYGGAFNPYYDSLASISGTIAVLAHQGTTSLDLNQGTSTTNAVLTNSNFSNTSALIMSGFYSV